MFQALLLIMVLCVQAGPSTLAMAGSADDDAEFMALWNEARRPLSTSVHLISKIFLKNVGTLDRELTDPSVKTEEQAKAIIISALKGEHGTVGFERAISAAVAFSVRAIEERYSGKANIYRIEESLQKLIREMADAARIGAARFDKSVTEFLPILERLTPRSGRIGCGPYFDKK